MWNHSEGDPNSRVDLYARSIEPGGSDSLSMLVEWIRPGTAVLDVGSAGGALGQYLTLHRNCVVDGVDQDIGAVALARRHYRRIVVADLGRSDLASLFPPGSYDYVVCADVLEHLQRPKEVLKSVHALLRDEGRLLISMPNLAYAPLLAELLQGQLQYRPVGLLDESHLRFVTRASLEQMLAEAGFATVALSRVVKPAHESEFDSRYLEALPPVVRNFLEQQEEAYTYQYLVDAVVGDLRLAAAESRAAAHGKPLPLLFVARLYWRTEASSYGAERHVQVLGEIGAGPQTLRFTLPREAGEVSGLLLELADREAILELKSLRILGPEGLAWSWSGLAEDLRRAPHERMTFAERQEPGPGAQAIIWAREPRLELPVGRRELAGCRQGCTVEAEVHWPPSPEYMHVLERLRERFAELDSAQRLIGDLTAERDRLGPLLDERLRRLRESEEAWRQAITERDRALALLGERLRLLETTSRQVAELTAERDRLGSLLDDRLRLLQATEKAWEEAVQERDRALALLEKRLDLLGSTSRQVAELTAERDRLGSLLDDRLRLLQATEKAWEEAVQERDRALTQLESAWRRVRELEARREPLPPAPAEEDVIRTDAEER